MTEDRKTVEVVAAMITDGAGRVLATQCPPHKHGGGWEFPGGKIEPGEAAAHAIEREIREELSLEVRAGELLHTIEWDYPTFHLRMYCYACRRVGGELCLHEHADARWLRADELDSVAWVPADVDALPAVRAWLCR